MRHSSFRLASALAMALAAPAGPAAFGQTSKTDTTFQDWLVSCADQGSGKACSLSQTFTNSATKQVVLALVFAMQADESLKAVLYTPTGVSIPAGVTITVGDLPPVVAQFQYCGPQACVAEFPFADDWAEAFRKQVQYTVVFKPVTQAEDASVNGSLKGFSAAYDFFIAQDPVPLPVTPLPAN